MFEIGFWELCLVGIVALLVLGPEKLPRAARTAGYWLGRAQRMVASMKAEIERELDLEDMKQLAQHTEFSKFSNLSEPEKDTNTSVSSSLVEPATPHHQFSDPPDKLNIPSLDSGSNVGSTPSKG